MYRYFAITILAFILCGCTGVSPNLNASNKTVVADDKQIFAGEDLLILQALDAQQQGEYITSALLYKELYEKSSRDEYLKNSIRLFLGSDDWSEVGDLIHIGIKNYPQDFDYERFYIAKLIKDNNASVAKERALELVKKERNEQNLRILGAIYLYTQEFDLSLKYFESAYNLVQSEQILMQIVELYLKLGKTDVAVSQLETYTRLKGCTKTSCYKLIDIYGKQKNVDGLLSTYKSLYKAYGEDEQANKIFEILMFQNKRAEAIKFLEESLYNPEILLEMYFLEKKFDKAISLAKDTYIKTGDTEYLAKIAIYEYESASNKTGEVIKSVSEKFEKYIDNKSDPLYLNYYGYLLIDHDVDIPKGIKLVLEALRGEPDSPYYQDSLAWGFYKQKKCKDAHDIMLKVLEKLNDKEVLGHFDLIKACEIKE